MGGVRAGKLVTGRPARCEAAGLAPGFTRISDTRLLDFLEVACSNARIPDGAETACA